MSDILKLFDASKKELPEIRYTLPSSGEELLLRPFTTREQKAILKAMEKEDQILVGEAFDQLLRRCVVSKKFDPGALLAKDRECLLIKLRLESVKDEFEHTWKCGECEKGSSALLNLNDIKFDDVVEKGPFKKVIVLDGFSTELVLGVATRNDEKCILQHAKKHSRNEEISQIEVLNAAYASVIKGIKGEKKKMVMKEDGQSVEETEEYTLDVSFKDRLEILEKMSLDDKSKIKAFFDEIKDYGYNLKIGYLPCKHCGHEEDHELEWLSFFIL